jgi:hypothetical protein
MKFDLSVLGTPQLRRFDVRGYIDTVFREDMPLEKLLRGILGSNFYFATTNKFLEREGRQL